MSYSLDANVLIYASDESSVFYRQALQFLGERVEDSDLLCLTWLTIMAYQRISTHPAIFKNPLSPAMAWSNISRLLARPRVRVIGEQSGFSGEYERVTGSFSVRGNHVPDAHLATILRQNGVKTIYTADADFRKFPFLEVVDPFAD